MTNEIRPTRYGNSRCPRCTGQLAWDDEAYCLNCGYRERVTPLATYYARQERIPTSQTWARRPGSKTPETRKYE